MKYDVPLDADTLTDLIYDLREGTITPQEYAAIIDRDKKASMIKPKDMNNDDVTESQPLTRL